MSVISPRRKAAMAAAIVPLFLVAHGICQDESATESTSPEFIAPVPAEEYLDISEGVDCDSCQSCRAPHWAHRTQFFGEYLFLRAGDAEIAYAAQVDGPVAPPPNQGIQVGPMGIVEQQYEPAYRVGGSFCLSPCASISVSYASFASHRDSAIDRSGTNVIRSLVTHPLVANAASDWVTAAASHDIDFQLADVEYRWLFDYGANHSINLLAGARYGHMEQSFRSLFSDLATRTVDTDIKFDGGGIRVGAEFRRYRPCTGLFLYGNTSASFLASAISASYRQGASFDPDEVETLINDNRIVTILDLELGLGWEHCVCHHGTLSISAGYLVSAWLNAVNTDPFIDSVHANHFSDIGGDTTTFDGLAAQIEYRF